MTFEFNGIKSSDMGFYILNFDGFSNDGVGTRSHYTFNTSKPANSKKWNFHGAKTEEQLTKTYQIGKLDCNKRDMELTREEFAFLQRWLERSDGYKYLRFLEDGYEDTYFNCQLQVNPIKLAGDKLVGAEVTITCDSIHGYSGIRTFEVSCQDGDTFQIYNDSDEIGSIIFDQLEIVMTSDASELCISNEMDTLYSSTPYNTTIQNCVNGENIVLANLQIKSNTITQHTKQNIANDFNFNYPRLINLADMMANGYEENRVNTFKVTGGSCDLNFSYRVTRTVMP